MATPALYSQVQLTNLLLLELTRTVITYLLHEIPSIIFKVKLYNYLDIDILLVVIGHPLLDVTDRWVAPIDDSPKPPPCRVTLTYPVINNALSAVFAFTGSAKADLVRV